MDKYDKYEIIKGVMPPESTDDEIETVSDNLAAFINNFGKPRITKEDAGDGFYVFYPADKPNDSWIQFCYNVSYLDGWLYGIVQGRHRGEFKPRIMTLTFQHNDEFGDELNTMNINIETFAEAHEIMSITETIQNIKQYADSGKPIEDFDIPDDWFTMSWENKIRTICNFMSWTTKKFNLIDSKIITSSGS